MQQGLKEIYDQSNISNVSERVCDSLRQVIINKIFPASSRLVEAKIAKELNVSITPVRAAFAQLDKEGLIEVYPYRGSYVKALDEKYIRDVSSIRLLLEYHAADLAFEHLSSQELAKMYRLCDSWKTQEDASVYTCSKIDMEFHDVIFQSCQNQLLWEIWQLMKPRVQLITSYGKMKTMPHIQVDRHLLLIHILETGDKPAFLAEIARHCSYLEEDSTNILHQMNPCLSAVKEITAKI